MRTCSCGARTPMSSSSSPASSIGADSGLSSARGCTGAAPEGAVHGHGLAAGQRVELRDQRIGHGDRAALADPGDHRMQAIEAALERVDAVAAEFALAVGDRLQQRLHGVAEFADGHDAGHARTTLEGVQVALQADHQLAFARIVPQVREQAVGMVEQVDAFLDEDVEQLLVQVAVSSGSSGSWIACGGRDRVAGHRFGRRLARGFGLDTLGSAFGFGVSVRLRHARLRGVRLRGVRLRHARLRHARLRRVRLRHVRLRGARLRAFGFGFARLRGARLRARSASRRSASSTFGFEHARLRARSASSTLGFEHARLRARSASRRSASRRSASRRSASRRSASRRSASRRSASTRSASRRSASRRSASRRSASRRSASRRSASSARLRGARLRGVRFHPVRRQARLRAPPRPYSHPRRLGVERFFHPLGFSFVHRQRRRRLLLFGVEYLEGFVNGRCEALCIRLQRELLELQRLGRNPLGLEAFRFDTLGFEALGFDALGFDALGFDALGFDALGFEAFGFEAFGFEAFGFEALGFERSASRRSASSRSASSRSASRRSASSVRLRGVRLRGVRLRGVRLRGVRLRGVRLRVVRLRVVRLRVVRLRVVRLRVVRLRGVRLRGVRLRGARLRGVRLRGVRLRRVRLRGARLRGVRLRGARLRVAFGFEARGIDVREAWAALRLTVAGIGMHGQQRPGGLGQRVAQRQQLLGKRGERRRPRDGSIQAHHQLANRFRCLSDQAEALAGRRTPAREHALEVGLQRSDDLADVRHLGHREGATHRVDGAQDGIGDLALAAAGARQVTVERFEVAGDFGLEDVEQHAVDLEWRAAHLHRFRRCGLDQRQRGRLTRRFDDGLTDRGLPGLRRNGMRRSDLRFDAVGRSRRGDRFRGGRHHGRPQVGDTIPRPQAIGGLLDAFDVGATRVLAAQRCQQLRQDGLGLGRRDRPPPARAGWSGRARG
jgi:uncharacterized protein YjbI with pentapeptide repeats